MESQGKMLVALSVLAVLTGFSAIGYVAVQKNANVVSRAQTSPAAADSVATTSTTATTSTVSTASTTSPFAASSVVSTGTTTSSFGKTCSTSSQGDFDCNGAVDCADLMLFMSELTGNASSKSSDISADGKVSLIDFEQVRAAVPAGTWTSCKL